MEDLIGQLEAAEVGSRELDGAIHRSMFPDDLIMTDPGSVGSVWRRPKREPIGSYPELPGLTIAECMGVSPYTESMDAALALAERVLPKETFWEVSHNAVINGQRMYHADVFPPYQSGEATFWGYGPHPALALCIAILRAKMETEK